MRAELSSITVRVLWTLTGLLDSSALPSGKPPGCLKKINHTIVSNNDGIKGALSHREI